MIASAPIRADLLTGLDRAFLMPVGHGTVDLLAGARATSGPFARVQATYHPTQQLGLNAFVEASRREAMAGVGVQLRF